MSNLPPANVRQRQPPNPGNNPDGTRSATQRYRSVFFFLVIVVVLAWIVTLNSQPRHSGPAGQVIFDPASRDIMAHADLVEAFEVTDPPDGVLHVDANHVAYHQILGTGNALNAELVGRLNGTLLDAGTASYSQQPECQPPAVALRYSRGADVVGILLFFDCSDMLLVRTHGQSEEHLERMSFAKARQPLLQLASEALPEDSALKKLARQVP